MAAELWRPGLGVLLCALHVQAACRGSAVSQELLKEGFHRELLVKVELSGTGQWTEGCTVAARTHLPRGVYVDPYELASLQQHNVTKAVLIPDAVDVEAPEYSATDLTVLLYLQPDPRCWHCFRAALPVHGRYHRPAESSEDALVALKGAEILLCCCDEHLSPECWQPAEVEAPCSEEKEHLCQWYSAAHQPPRVFPSRISLSLLSSCSFRIPWASFLCFCWNSIESSSCDFARNRLASALTVGSCFPLAVLNDGGCASASSTTSEASCSASVWGKGGIKEQLQRAL
ncbi:phosphatidylinositol-glycan biosynthesis class X protein isoform X1 [Tympanuchus pallidicinctus]|uniref:phosphatidylinositol-glycan biosynthesis class X protein isoform X1 n=1 Tax=Tympanuchus pallidicinctus TaxID=109042 RepID=UPI00228708F1|nr:phosphatidylinositol-glycan biosynthesis class X protein isoform X1 [Tympanuchus pallidicinctus]